MYESISKNNELENEMTLDMSYFWYSDDICRPSCHIGACGTNLLIEREAM